jgi:hypothetical protein
VARNTPAIVNGRATARVASEGKAPVIYSDGLEVRFGDFVRYEMPGSPPSEAYVLGEMNDADGGARVLLTGSDITPQPVEASHCALKSRGYEWMLDEARDEYMDKHPGVLMERRWISALDDAWAAMATIRQAIMTAAPHQSLPPQSRWVEREAEALAAAIRELRPQDTA